MAGWGAHKVAGWGAWGGSHAHLAVSSGERLFDGLDGSLVEVDCRHRLEHGVPPLRRLHHQRRAAVHLVRVGVRGEGLGYRVRVRVQGGARASVEVGVRERVWVGVRVGVNGLWLVVRVSRCAPRSWGPPGA